MRVNLLIVEDDLGEIEDWKKIVSRHNVMQEAEPSLSFHFDIAKNIDEARSKIRIYNFSIAIIDVRLKRKEDADAYNNTDGLDVLNEIMETTSCFSVVYTGQPKDAFDNISHEHQNYIRVVDRTTSKSNLLKILSEDDKDIILSIHEMKNKFSKSMSSLFYKSIWPRWKYWKDSEINSDALHRHMATHLHASFLNETVAVHPEEYYFIPPFTKELDTGCITLKDEKHYILITPRCEIAQRKNNTFQFIELKDISEELKSINDADIKLKKELNELISKEEVGLKGELEKIETKRKNIANNSNKKRNLLNNGGNKASLHFLPEIRQSKELSSGPFHAQFDHMISIGKNDLESLELFKSGIYACLSNEFVPSLIERLGNYFSRIGSPDYSHPE